MTVGYSVQRAAFRNISTITCAMRLGMPTNRIDFDVRQIIRLVCEQPATALDRNRSNHRRTIRSFSMARLLESDGTVRNHLSGLVRAGNAPTDRPTRQGVVRADAGDFTDIDARANARRHGMRSMTAAGVEANDVMRFAIALTVSLDDCSRCSKSKTGAPCAPHRATRSVVSGRHQRDVRRIAPRRKRPSNSAVRDHSSGHHAIAKTALRGGAVNARSRAHSRAGGAQRRGIDGAEHSSRIGCVMSALR